MRFLVAPGSCRVGSRPWLSTQSRLANKQPAEFDVPEQRLRSRPSEAEIQANKQRWGLELGDP
jgi:hypothetical protein